jgi:hypothetical protein
MKGKTPKINFLRKQRRVFSLQSKRLRLIQAMSLTIAGIYSVVLLGVLAYTDYLQYKLKSVQQNINDEEEAMNNWDETAFKYFAIKSKLGTILEINESLHKHQKFIEKTFNLVPVGAEMAGLSINEDEVIVFNLQTKHPQVIESFIQNVEAASASDEDGIYIAKAEVSSVSVGEDGVYGVPVKLKLFIEE